MQQEQIEEWYVLEQRAMEQLRKGNAFARAGLRCLYRLLVLPSFYAAFRWEICQEVKGTGRCFAIHTVWRRDTDLSKLETPVVRLRYPRPLMPTFEINDAPLDVEWVESKWAALKSITIPAAVEVASFGTDGTAYEVEFDAGVVRGRYGWWHKPPEAWRPLDLWMQQTLTELEQKVVSESP